MSTEASSTGTGAIPVASTTAPILPEEKLTRRKKFVNKWKDRLKNPWILGSVVGVSVAAGTIFYGWMGYFFWQWFVDRRQRLTSRELYFRGGTLYGTWWCKFCHKQLDLFGPYKNYIRYVECSQPDSHDQSDYCKQKGIRAYPTWELKNTGHRHQGSMTMRQLREWVESIPPRVDVPLQNPEAVRTTLTNNTTLKTKDINLRNTAAANDPNNSANNTANNTANTVPPQKRQPHERRRRAVAETWENPPEEKKNEPYVADFPLSKKP